MAINGKKKANRLIDEKSPYLLQHAYNPVDWYPWGDEAFDKARRENKPIFLSIGYSTCHWCHVMEHESFENGPIAETMKKYYISIKVDREERPDVDKVYMSAVQAMTGSGGWPLSTFLTPDLKPFYGGTYFPPKDAHGRPGFPTVLERIHQFWEEEREKVSESAEQLITLLRQNRGALPAEIDVDESVLKKTYHQFAAQYDPKYGGFGGGPKFPRPAVFDFLFRYFDRTNNPEALTMALTTLQSMARGGMYDQIGGGFHRYSVDEQWRVPHFEKMLYDQAQLVNSYLEAYQVTRDEFYARVARETLDYVLRDMTDPGGGFYSAEDADSPDPGNPSHSSEGAFYLWTKAEIEKILDIDDAKIFCHHFGVAEEGNALLDPLGEFSGKNVLFGSFTLEQTAKIFSRDEAEVESVLVRSRKKLFEVRNKRPRPQRDDKIITAWNGLMIGAFARASRIFDEPRYEKAASSAAHFVINTMCDKTALKRRYRDGEAKFEAQLDDYAFFIQGLLDAYETTFDVGLLKLALALHGTQVALFWDATEGGFHDFSGKDASILLRTKESYDGAEPAGNSVASMNLIRLSQITDDAILKKKTEKTLRLFNAKLQQAPHAMPFMMAAIVFFLSTPKQIVIAGEKTSPDTRRLLKEITRRYHPNKIVLLADGNEGQEFLSERLPFMASMAPVEKKATAYVCENYACNLPITDPAQFRAILDQRTTPLVA
jgi:hypothetical protein